LPTLDCPRHLKLAGGEIRIHATGADSDGQLELFEFVVPPTYPGPSRHVHQKADELFILLEGHGRFELGSEVLYARAGDRVLVNRGVPHAFRNAGETNLRMLCAFTPAIGMAEYFPRLVDLLARTSGRPQHDAMLALWERFDTLPA
jgi:mannose-6-phosphate isomerase-like protein (cupin superfamily)